MQTKLFVGLTFHEDNFFARKIQGFRNRFDEKIQSNPAVHMPLVAPFEIPASGVNQLEQDIADSLEGFFFGDAGTQSVSFTGVDVFTHAKRSLLFLHPAEQTDLLHCEEALIQICQGYVEDRAKGPKKDKKFVTIGRFHEPTSLHAAMAVAQAEFSDCSELPVKGISLFRKNQGIWYQQHQLLSLENPKGLP